VHGQERRYQHSRLGINGRLDTIQAAILLAKLERFDSEIDRRRQLGGAYTALIKEKCPNAITPHIEPHATSVYAQYTSQVDNRDELGMRLKEVGIPTAVHYPTPLHLQPALARFDYSKVSMPVAEAAANRVMSLPMGPDLLETDQRHIVQVLATAISTRKATA
jgi:UDP-2-acetamido-2-deoxy-ribo-hexuluronate aminotransferase